MDGNLAMANKIVNETEKENNFWADVYYYMEEHDCNKETAMAIISASYMKLESEKKTEEETDEECSNCGGSGFAVASVGFPCGVCDGTGVIRGEED